MVRPFLLALGLSTMSAVAGAEDLIQVFNRALASDPAFREADALRKAALETKPQALSVLLPQLSAGYGYNKDESDGVSRSTFVLSGSLVPSDRSGEADATNKRWSVDLRQSVFSWANWVALKRADKEVAQAEVNYQAAQQDLIARVAARYFDVLASRDSLDAQESALEAIDRQLEQAEKRFEVGLIAITDVQESRAARDNALSLVIGSKRTLASSEEALREVTGELYATLNKPGDQMPLQVPEPNDETKWVEQSMAQNLDLMSSRLGADIARDNVRAAFSGHLPTLDLFGSYGNSEQDSESRLNSGAVSTSFVDQDLQSWGLQFSLPIFSGGLTQSRVRQSEYQWQAARERLTRTSRATERESRDAFLGVNSEIARVNALKRAVESNETALKATEAGYEVGTRTTVDVLDARRSLALAQTAYARSRYDYLLNVLRLRRATGMLDVRALEEVNAWLTIPQATWPKSSPSPAGVPAAAPPAAAPAPATGPR